MSLYLSELKKSTPPTFVLEVKAVEENIHQGQPFRKCFLRLLIEKKNQVFMPLEMAVL